MWAFLVHAFRVVSHNRAGNLTNNIECAIIIVHSIFEIQRCRIISCLVAKIAFLQFYDTLHQWVAQFEPELRMIRIMICHCLSEYNYLLCAL